MAGNNDRHPIVTVGSGHRPDSARATNAPRLFRVGRHLAVGNLSQTFPDALLKLRSRCKKGNREFSQLPFEVAVQLLLYFSYDRAFAWSHQALEALL